MPEIIALAGRIASGKSKAAELLRREYDMEHIEYSSFLYQALDLFCITHMREHIDLFSTFIRARFGQDAFSRAVSKRLSETTKRWVVLSTIRRASDLDGIKEQYPIHLWYVDADQQIRYKRHVSSARKIGDADMTYDEFRRIEENEVQSSIPLLKKEAEVVLENNGNYEAFLNEIRTNANTLVKFEQ